MVGYVLERDKSPNLPRFSELSIGRVAGTLLQGSLLKTKTTNRVSSCGDFAPKWRFQRPSGARLSVAIRHLKGGDFGKLVEKPQKVAFLSQTWRF